MVISFNFEAKSPVGTVDLCSWFSHAIVVLAGKKGGSMPNPNPWDIPEDFAERFTYPDELMDGILDPEPLQDALFGDYPKVDW